MRVCTINVTVAQYVLYRNTKSVFCIIKEHCVMPNSAQSGQIGSAGL